MDPVSPLPVLACLLAATGTCWVLIRIFGAPSEAGRFSTIDGLRGYLALLVFLHHSCAWYFYLRSGTWDVPPSILYNNFGPRSVGLFFMITGFLFFNKIIEARTKPLDWARLYVSRILRLFPLYLVVILVLFLVVAFLSGGHLHEPVAKLSVGITRWLSCGILGSPDLNGVKDTFIIVAGVMWSLRYEWFYYLSLPILALAVGVRAPIRYLVLSVITVAVGLALWQPSYHQLVTFGGGMVACFFVRIEWCRKFASSWLGSVVTLGCVLVCLAVYPEGSVTMPLLLLSVAFVLIACGSSLFGLLTNPASRVLGEMAYGIYLVHGLTLFVLFNFVIGLAQAREFSPLQHWILLVGITPILVLLCFFIFRRIEQPGLAKTPAWTAWLRSRFARGRKIVPKAVGV